MKNGETNNLSTNTSSLVHLHVHTPNSMKDSVARIEDLITSAKQNNMKALAITDHGVMHGVIDFYNACKANDIKPIVGCEVYVAPQHRTEKDTHNRYYHLVLLAKDYEGYINLCRLSSRGFTEGFYYKPRVDKELLKEFSKGLICLSACISGEIPKLILKDEFDKAKEVALEFQNIFGKENFFIEVQNHFIPEEQKSNRELIKIAKEIDAKVVATNDIHYTFQEDSLIQDVVKCIDDKKTMDDPTRNKFYNDQFYFKNELEMKELFPDNPEFIDNTSIVAEMCNLEMIFGDIHLPKYEYPSEFSSNYEYLKHISETGFKERYGDNPSKEYVERLNYELTTIKNMGFVDYFLIVWDYINFARTRKIKVGPGRGSGAGSIVAYCTKITSMDPMRFGLIFERFLNPERISLPDFDIDFEPDRRPEIFQYLSEKYGISNSAKVLAIQTMAAKNALRDCAKVFNISTQEAQSWSNMIPKDPSITLEKALKESPDFAQLYKNNKDAKKIINIAIRLEGLPRQTSSHAAGVIIADKAIENYAPIMIAKDKDTKEEHVVVQFNKKLLEPLGLIKMDILGLRNLTLLNNAEQVVRATKNADFLIDEVDYDDKKVYEHLCQPNGTIGVFQLESEGITKATIQIKPNCIEDIIALIALYRPGPMDNIPTYIKNKHNPTGIQYSDDRLASILDVTYGVIIYQEQVMQIYREFGGFSMGRSDIVRKAMSDKKRAVLDVENEIFKNGLKDENGNTIIEGALKKGFNEKVIDYLIEDMEKFASYAFNKSHSAVYADVGYKTAYMMTYYPNEYYAEILSSVIGDGKKLRHYISIGKNTLKLDILKPDINKSLKGFSVVNDSILFGLEALDSVGPVFVNKLIYERDTNGEFKDIFDFVYRMQPQGLGLSCLQSLIFSGSLDDYGYNRNTLSIFAEYLLDCSSKFAQYNTMKFPTIFDFSENSYDLKLKFIFPKIEKQKELPVLELLNKEYESTNIFISKNPLEEYSKSLERLPLNNYDDIVVNVEEQTGKYRDKQPVLFAFIITEIVEKITKKKQKMAIIKVTDGNAAFDVVVFPKAYEYNDYLFEKGNTVLCKGTLEFDTYDETSVKSKFFGNKFLLIPNNQAPLDDITRFRKSARGFKTVAKKQEFKTPDYAITPETTENYHYNKGLYIRCKDKNHIKQIMQLFIDKKCVGTYTVFLYNLEDKKVYKSSVARFNPMDKEIIELLTKNNLTIADIKFCVN